MQSQDSTRKVDQDISMYKGPVGPLRHRCPLCPSSRPAAGSQLLRCGGCRAFRYCGREHQAAHRLEHKRACAKIKNARSKLVREDHAVRNATPDFMTPANAFETCVGQFWGILSTRDYMRARFALARLLFLLGTLDGVGEGLEHLRDMLRLCRGDNMGVRNIMPALMLRLDLDQECYDFMKWWATCDPDGTYDWGDMTLPYLSIRGADVFEEPGFLLGKYANLDYVVALLILKLKLLIDIINLKVTRKVLARRHLPFELRDQIERDVVRSPLSAKVQKESPESFHKTETTLLDHIRQLSKTIMENNEAFTLNLLDPEDALTSQPSAYTRGSWEEMALVMQNSYAAWWETEGVLDLLRDALVCAARDLQGLGFGVLRDENERLVTERLADVGPNFDLYADWVWRYLYYAVENASYLGPWPERPSEKYTREGKENKARTEFRALFTYEPSSDDEEAFIC
ncbi:hypothetical protein F5Y03DRAFT_356566 [Xylaria venustula]|nr:hypothetical protein F5Y03DRAFT_356566 [Xylaria venustula]